MPSVRPSCLWLLTAAVVGADGQAVAQRANRSPERVSQVVDSLAREALAGGQAAGFSVGVALGSSVRLTRGYGEADLEHGVATTTETVYRIASVTKQFTAAAVVQLAEAGRLSLDDRLTKFFPDWPAPGDAVTIRMLLNHTSGIRDYVGLPRWDRVRTLALPHDSLLALFKSEPFDFAPGTGWRYSNAGYYLLGVIVEKVSEQRYGDYIERKIGQPLGLKTLRYCDSRPIIPGRARGYNRVATGFVNAAYIDMNQPFAAGSLCATVGDLLTWSQALASGRVVSAAGYREMVTPAKLPDDQPMVYGFGLSVGQLGGHPFVYHNGSIDGFHAQLITYPADSLTVAVLANTEVGLPETLERRISRVLLDIPEPRIVDLPVPDGLRGRVTGSYRQGDAQIVVSDGPGGLTIALPGSAPTRLLHQGDESFVPDARRGIVVTFRGTGGPATALLLSAPGAAMTFQRAAP